MGFAYPIDSKVVTNPNGTIDYDRASSSTQLRGLIKSMITNGVNLTESTNLQVMADDETMNLIVKPGYVIIEGALKHFEEDVKVKISNADSSHPRIDTVVARLNLNEDVRDIVIDVLQGTPSANPTAPELSQNTSTYYELGLADILVEVGATQISQAVVTDTRLLNSRCGMISAIGEIDTETLFNQLTTDFDNWFESIKGQLGDDVAGSLQMQINEHKKMSVSTEEGAHGIRCFDNALGIYNEKTQKWDNFGIPPRPVTGVTGSLKNYRNGINEFKASWTLPPVYDVQIDKVGLYGYVGETMPTSFSQFELITELGNTSTSVSMNVDKVYNYILVGCISAEGVIQKDLGQMCNINVILDLPVKERFSTMSWEDISFVSERGLAHEYFKAGDTRTIEMTGTSYKIVVYGFNHDDKADGTGKAGLTIGLLNCLTTSYQMKSSESNNGGWTSCLIRTTLNDTIYYTLPEELRNVIKSVTKKTSDGYQSSTIKQTTDKLFLLSEVEVCGSSNYSFAGEGSRYPYFASSSTRAKKIGDAGTSNVNWWLRSPYTSDYDSFLYIYYNTASSSGASMAGADGKMYVSFAFCV